MSLTLHYHPLASYCWKALIALYETGATFTPQLVDLQNAEERAAFIKIWPIGKFPVLRDEAHDRTVPEATIIIEYLAQHYPGSTELIPRDPELALKVRLTDRFYDLYVHEQMQKIVLDRLRPVDSRDTPGVEAARKTLATSYAMIEKDMAGKTWAGGEQFTMADCAASPALYYANKVAPFGDYPNVGAYLDRLMERPSFARVLAEAEPYFKMFPQ